MIPVFVASTNKFNDIEAPMVECLRDHTRHQVDVRIIRPQWYGMQETGCTGFTNVRYAVPQLAREAGYDFGIYLDVDMFVLGDIAELWEYRQVGKWVCLEDGSNEVSVVCASLPFPDKRILHQLKKWELSALVDADKRIPKEWNCEDTLPVGCKLLHFTDLKTQPWFFEHPCAEAVAIWQRYAQH